MIKHNLPMILIIGTVAFLLIPKSGSTSPSACEDLRRARDAAWWAYSDAANKAREAATETRNAQIEWKLRVVQYRLARSIVKKAEQILEYAIELDDEDEIAAAQNLGIDSKVRFSG